MVYQRLWQIIGIVYLVFVLIISLIPTPNIETPLSHSDKIVHFLIYFIMVSWFGQTKLFRFKLRYIIVLSIVFGILIELLQSLTSYRQFESFDILANSLGSLSAYALLFTHYQYLLNRFDKKLQTLRR